MFLFESFLAILSFDMKVVHSSSAKNVVCEISECLVYKLHPFMSKYDISIRLLKVHSLLLKGCFLRVVSAARVQDLSMCI